MKKILIILVTTFVFCSGVNAAAGTVSVSSESINVGDTFTVTATMNQAASWLFLVKVEGPVNEDCIVYVSPNDHNKFIMNEEGDTPSGTNTNKTFTNTCTANEAGVIKLTYSGGVRDEASITPIEIGGVYNITVSAANSGSGNNNNNNNNSSNNNNNNSSVSGNNNATNDNSATGNVGDSRSFKITYDANGGTGDLSYENVSGFEDDTYILINSHPKRDGMTFLGWSTNKDATEPDETYANGQKYYGNLGDITLYAVWSSISAEPTANPKTGVATYILATTIIAALAGLGLHMTKKKNLFKQI